MICKNSPLFLQNRFVYFSEHLQLQMSLLGAGRGPSVKNLQAAERFVSEVVGLAPVLGGHARGCSLFHGAPAHHLAICAARPSSPAMQCEDSEPLAVTYSLVVASTAEVFQWYDRLVWANANAGAPVADVANPARHQSSFGFTFSDVNRESGLGCMRFEVLTYAEDPTWRAPACAPVAGESKPPGVGSPAASAQARLAYSQPREKSLVAVEERRKEDQKIAAGAPQS